MIFRALLFLGFVAFIQAASTSCSATATTSQKVGSTWSDNQSTFTLYDISVSNPGDCTLKSIEIQITIPAGANITQSWGLGSTSSPNVWMLQNFYEIQSGHSYDSAGFIVKFTTVGAVTISAGSVNCSTQCGSSTSAPTSPPSKDMKELIQDLLLAPTELDREDLLSDNEFVFDFVNSMTGLTVGAGGKTVAATRSNFPALIAHGVAMTVGFLGPCSINLPHTHPRATEINFIVSGEIRAGFFQENMGRFIGNTLKPGMATVFPQGAIHFEVNTGCTAAMFVAAFNNEDPGVQTTASSFFGLPKDIAAISLNISSIQTVEDLMAHLPHNPALDMGECRTRCGL